LKNIEPAVKKKQYYKGGCANLLSPAWRCRGTRDHSLTI